MNWDKEQARTAQMQRDKIAAAKYAERPGLAHMAEKTRKSHDPMYPNSQKNKGGKK